MKPHRILRKDHDGLSVILRSWDFLLGALVCVGGEGRGIAEGYNKGNDIIRI